MKKEKLRQGGLTAVSNSFFLTFILIIIQLVAWIGFYYVVTDQVGHRYALFFQIVVVVLIVFMISYFH